MSRMLVLKPSSLGDIIHGLQVVESIRGQQPDLHITWVVESAFRQVVESSETVDEFFIFERKGGLGSFIRLLRQIRSVDFDIVLDLQGLARSGLMTAAARAPRKIGRSDAREGAGLFYQEKLAPPSGKDVHAVEILAQTLPHLGLEKKVVSTLRFDFPEMSLPVLEESLQTGVLVFPESRRPEKEWPEFPSFIEKAAATDPERTFLWCASGRSEAVCPKSPNIINLAGKTDLCQVIALIQGARAIVANDSGPVHIAAAVGTPVVGLYGPTAPEQYGPYPLDHPNHRVLSAKDGRMSSILVDQVLGALGELI